MDNVTDADSINATYLENKYFNGYLVFCFRYFVLRFMPSVFCLLCYVFCLTSFVFCLMYFVLKSYGLKIVWYFVLSPHKIYHTCIYISGSVVAGLMFI